MNAALPGCFAWLRLTRATMLLGFEKAVASPYNSLAFEWIQSWEGLSLWNHTSIVVDWAQLALGAGWSYALFLLASERGQYSGSAPDFVYAVPHCLVLSYSVDCSRCISERLTNMTHFRSSSIEGRPSQIERWAGLVCSKWAPYSSQGKAFGSDQVTYSLLCRVIKPSSTFLAAIDPRWEAGGTSLSGSPPLA